MPLRRLLLAAVAAAVAVAVLAAIYLLRSGGGGGYGVTFIVEPSALQVDGRQLFGHVQVVVSTPEGPLTREYRVGRGERLVVHVSIPERVVERWMEFYRQFEEYAGKAGVHVPGKPLPTVSLIFYLYDDQGGSYRGMYSFSTVTYLTMFKGMPTGKAVEIADKDPFLAFREKPTIVLKSPADIGLHRVG